jgi:hypothetical protein
MLKQQVAGKPCMDGHGKSQGRCLSLPSRIHRLRSVPIVLQDLMQPGQFIFHYIKMAHEVGGFGEVQSLGRAAQIVRDKTANHAHVSPSLFASFIILPRRVRPCHPNINISRDAPTSIQRAGVSGNGARSISVKPGIVR